MNSYDTVIIGHIPKIHNIDYKGNESELISGAVIQSCNTAHFLGYKTAVITKLNKNNCGRLSSLLLPEKDIYIKECDSSASIKNIYFSANKQKKESHCLSAGTPFEISDIPENIESNIFYISSILNADLPNKFIKKCAQKGLVALDIHPFFMNIDRKSDLIIQKEWKEKSDILPFVSFLKLNINDVEFLTESTNKIQTAKLLYQYGADEIFIADKSELFVYNGKFVYSYPIISNKPINPNEISDAAFTAYINERITKGISQSLLFSAAAASLKAASKEAFSSTRKEVEEYIEKHYK